MPIIKLMSLSLYHTFLDLVSDAEVVALQIAFFFFFFFAGLLHDALLLEDTRGRLGSWEGV